MRLKSALRRGVAAAVIAGIVVSSGIPAYAAQWDIADGDITVKAGDAEGTNRVTQGEKDVEDTDTVITGESKENTVTIDTSEGNVDVTFDDLKIDVSDKGEAAVRVEGNGDATIELDGKNELKSGGYNAGLEKDGHEAEGTLTIKDDKGKDGSLTAEGGDRRRCRHRRRNGEHRQQHQDHRRHDRGRGRRGCCRYRRRCVRPGPRHRNFRRQGVGHGRRCE